MNNIGLVIFVFTYLILFGLMTWWFCRLEDRWDKQDKSRTDGGEN